MRSFLLLFSQEAQAATTIPFLEKVKEQIVNPVIQLLFVLALLYFIWGVIQFIRDSNNEKGRATGRWHILWGTVGLFIMVSVFGIINFICDTVGAC